MALAQKQHYVKKLSSILTEGGGNSRSDDTPIFTVYSVPSSGLRASDGSFHLHLVTTQ